MSHRTGSLLSLLVIPVLGRFKLCGLVGHRNYGTSEEVIGLKYLEKYLVVRYIFWTHRQLKFQDKNP